MAGHGADDNPNLKGFARYFNSETNLGRANVSSGIHINWHRMMFAAVRPNLFIHSSFVLWICSGPKQLMLLSVWL